MNKLVYLHELDSVRNTEKAIEIGQQALFEEIVVKGNVVVLTFNQIADSEAFLCAIKNPETYEHIIDLFKTDAIRVSRFGEIRTASKYMQDAICKCLARDDNAFLFSGIPVRCNEKELLEKLLIAIKYSDPSLLVEELDLLKGKRESCSDPAEIEKLDHDIKRHDYLRRFVRMILDISTQALASNPVYDRDKKTFLKFMEWIFEGYEKIGFGPERNAEIAPIMGNAIEFLKMLQADFYNSYEKTEAESLMQNRTNWINKISDYVKSEDNDSRSALADCIVHLCYNYTMEDSINGISRHYLKNDLPSFWEDFSVRTANYWEQTKQQIHRQHTIDSESPLEYNIDFPNWESAVRLLKENRRKEEPLVCNEKYEDNILQEKHRWKDRIKLMVLKNVGLAFLYAFGFVLVEMAMNFVQEWFENTAEVFRVSDTMCAILSVITFGVISALVANKMPNVDILSSVVNLFNTIKDYRTFKKARRGVSYEKK